MAVETPAEPGQPVTTLPTPAGITSTKRVTAAWMAARHLHGGVTQ